MERNTQILIAGAGAAGLTLGLALAHAGFETMIVGELETARNGRTVALFDASVRLYRRLGLLSRLKPLSTPIERIRLVDDTGSLFSPAPTLLRSREIGLAAFGVNIENAVLVRALADAARATPGLRFTQGRLDGYILSSHAARARSKDEMIEARLLVGADGRRSSVRAAAGVVVREWREPQVAVTATVWHERPHRNTSTEFHTRSGPCTLVPLGPTSERAHRSSLVWLMSPDEATRRMGLSDEFVAAELRAQVHDLHGKMGMEGPRGAFPISGLHCNQLVGPRVALVADAGHAMPPIGAQGLNLGLRDVAQLVASVQKYGAADPGAPAVLSDFNRARRLDVNLRVASIAALNRSLLLQGASVDFLRAAGLFGMAAIGPLRRALMREGVAPPGRLPPLMRESGRRAAPPTSSVPPG